MAEPSLSEILEFALALSDEAGEFILPLWKSVAVDHKSDGSEVTEAVRDADHLWLVDPIDGTASFAIGLPLFGTLIGYLRRGEACIGVIGAHVLGETVYAAAGQGCWYRRTGRDPQRIRTSAVEDPARAFVISTALEHTDLDPRDPNPSVCLSQLYRRARRFR